MTTHPGAPCERVSDAHLAHVLEALPDAILLVDSTGRILLLNSQAGRLFGYEAGELAGGTLDILVPDRHHALARDHRNQLFLSALPATPPVRIELHARHKDGREFPVEMSLAALGTRSGTVAVTAIRDISERHDAGQALSEKNAELAAANGELEAFDYSIAHDLRAPLHRIAGFAAMIDERQGDRLDAEGRAAVGRIAQAAKDMDQLVTDILALATATRGTLARSVVDVTALAREIDAGLRKEQPGRDVQFSLQPGMKARADPGMLRAVLQNLLANAWKFTRGRAPARIRVGCNIAGGEHVFFVRDDGVGFDPAQAANLFKPFQRGAGNFEGNGIGLATVQRIAHRHGGRVCAEGTVGGGATIFFTLSRAEPAS
jgi:PAS domain S-box-containing protein